MDGSCLLSGFIMMAPFKVSVRKINSNVKEIAYQNGCQVEVIVHVDLAIIASYS